MKFMYICICSLHYWYRIGTKANADCGAPSNCDESLTRNHIVNNKYSPSSSSFYRLDHVSQVHSITAINNNFNTMCIQIIGNRD